MGLPFRRKDAPDAPPVLSPAVPNLSAVAHGETLRALIDQLLHKGTFFGSLDQNPAFAMELTPDGMQIAQNDADLALCILADRVAGFSLVGVDPGRMLFLIVDPIVEDIFLHQPDWLESQSQPDVWIARISMGSGLSLLFECKEGPAELAMENGARRGATLTLQVLTQH